MKSSLRKVWSSLAEKTCLETLCGDTVSEVEKASNPSLFAKAAVRASEYLKHNVQRLPFSGSFSCPTATVLSQSPWSYLSQTSLIPAKEASFAAASLRLSNSSFVSILEFEKKSVTSWPSSSSLGRQPLAHGPQQVWRRTFILRRSFPKILNPGGGKGPGVQVLSPVSGNRLVRRWMPVEAEDGRVLVELWRKEVV